MSCFTKEGYVYRSEKVQTKSQSVDIMTCIGPVILESLDLDEREIVITVQEFNADTMIYELTNRSTHEVW